MIEPATELRSGGVENAWPDLPVCRADMLAAVPRTSLQGGLDPLIRRVAFALYRHRLQPAAHAQGDPASKDLALADWLFAQSLVELMLDEMGHNL